MNMFEYLNEKNKECPIVYKDTIEEHNPIEEEKEFLDKCAIAAMGVIYTERYKKWLILNEENSKEAFRAAKAMTIEWKKVRKELFDKE